MAAATKGGPVDTDAAVGPAAEPVRIRRFFPETLYFNPAVITDGSGRAELDIPLADSITTWRLTCLASSAAGQLGSTTAGIRVFQDFFVDIDFPVSLTQNDEVHVPVAIYNYLKTDQKIRLQVEKEDWFVPCGIYEDNQEIIVEESLAMPDGFCQSAWMAIYPTVRTLGFGGNLPFFKKEGVAVSCCTDGIRPVVFKIERI